VQQPQAVDPALLASYRAYSDEVQPSEGGSVYFPDLPTAEVVERPSGPARRAEDDLMPRGRGRAPATGKAPVVIAGVAAVGLGAVFAVVLAGGHHTPSVVPAASSRAVHVDATAATSSASITVPKTATRGVPYTLKVPAGFIADAGNEAGSDVLLSEPVLDLHLRVQSRTNGAVPVPPGSPTSVKVAGIVAKGTESTVRGHAVRTVSFGRAGVTYTVTETVPADGKANTLKVLDEVLGAWSFGR
jgi:hypothetical protein